MNKAESKYFNTARLMDEALLILLENKSIEYISIKEICKKAGVNRSTFYLHYENIYDLLAECIEMLNERFQQSFNKLKIKQVENCSKPEVIFIKQEYITPYLTFIKDNKKVFKTIHKRPQLFNVNSTFNQMYENVFEPILRKFNVPKYKEPYLFEFYTRGIIGIIFKWIELDCAESIENITNIIIDCVNIDVNHFK